MAMFPVRRETFLVRSQATSRERPAALAYQAGPAPLAERVRLLAATRLPGQVAGFGLMRKT